MKHAGPFTPDEHDAFAAVMANAAADVRWVHGHVVDGLLRLETPMFRLYDELKTADLRELR